MPILQVALIALYVLLLLLAIFKAGVSPPQGSSIWRSAFGNMKSVERTISRIVFEFAIPVLICWIAVAVSSKDGDIEDAGTVSGCLSTLIITVTLEFSILQDIAADWRNLVLMALGFDVLSVLLISTGISPVRMFTLVGLALISSGLVILLAKTASGTVLGRMIPGGSDDK